MHVCANLNLIQTVDRKMDAQRPNYIIGILNNQQNLLRCNYACWYDVAGVELVGGNMFKSVFHEDLSWTTIISNFCKIESGSTFD